jgi:hypothetical protein
MVLACRYRAALHKTFELKRQQETNDRRRLGMAAVADGELTNQQQVSDPIT